MVSHIVLFQDDQLLSPFGLLRHLGLWRSGSLSLLEILFHLNPHASFAIVPFSNEKKQQLLVDLAYWEFSSREFPSLLKKDFFHPSGNTGDSHKNSGEQSFIFINARHVRDVSLLQKTVEQTQSLSVGEGFCGRNGWISGKLSLEKMEQGQVFASDFFPLLKPISIDEERLIEHSWQCISDLKSKMILQNKLRIKKGDLIEKQKGVWCPADFAGLHPSVVVCGASADAPVVLERGVQIAPYVVLEAPVYLADFSIVKPHTSLSCAAIGRNSKVGGEVQSSVIDDFSNKAHGGFLGHSMLGCWVNVGAGSEFSNLKNTYGPVRFDEGGKKRTITDKTFLGSLVGDFAKISINTSIFSGKVIGAAAMASGVVEKGLPNFYWKDDELVDLSSLLETQRRMFLRRGVEQTALHRELLTLVYKKN